jgi:hypothetical protein
MKTLTQNFFEKNVSEEFAIAGAEPVAIENHGRT